MLINICFTDIAIVLLQAYAAAATTSNVPRKQTFRKQKLDPEQRAEVTYDCFSPQQPTASKNAVFTTLPHWRACTTSECSHNVLHDACSGSQKAGTC